MTPGDPLADVAAAIRDLGLFRNPRRVDRPEVRGGITLDGEVAVQGREVTLRLHLSASFPLVLPEFYLQPWDALGFIPHVSPRGFVCYLDREGVVLDRRRPEWVVADALERAIGVLSAGVRGENQADFADEFEIYWSYLPGKVTAFSVLEPGDEVEEIILAFSKGDLRWVASAERDIAAFLSIENVGGAYSLQNALYVPLEPGTSLVPPRHDGPFWSAEQARQVLLAGMSETNRDRLRKLTNGRPRSREYVIAKLPRPSGGASLFGIRYEGLGQMHPLRQEGTANHLTPIRIDRLDRGYLVGRGGGTPELDDKRLLLVGCGAVGGHLAFEFARSGVLDLTLVDDDTIGSENVFRHVLGFRYLGKPKPQALKEELEAQLPFVRVRAIPKKIEVALAEGAIDLRAYDLVVFALGNPTVELALNEQIHAMGDGPMALFAWLEPLGIGGHALLVGNDRQGGCFECLYTPPEGGDGGLANRAAFAAPGQSFGRALSGCGSLHTPYGSIDATRTANLAARLAIDALAGREGGNPLLSWKGDAAAFQAAGFRTSPRHAIPEVDLLQHRFAYRASDCRVCGNRDGSRS
jgi:molybdopterin-synthase adenylyltransferase